jgi:hypothetical protein
MAKEKKQADFKDPNNWYLLDEVCRFYHTATLSDAILHFEKCKEVFECNRYGVPNAMFSGATNSGVTARNISLIRS